MKWFLSITFLLLTSLAISQEEQLVLKSLAGEVVPVNDVLKDGRKKVFIYWAPYCTQCKYEIKGVNQLNEKWATEYKTDVYLVSISGDRNKDDVEYLVNRLNWTGFNVMLDQGMKVYKSMDGDAIPFTLLFNEDGSLYRHWTGYDDGLEISIDWTLAKLTKQGR